MRGASSAMGKATVPARVGCVPHCSSHMPISAGWGFGALNLRRTTAFATASLLCALASPAFADPSAGSAANPDPWETFNRAGFAIHQAIDHAVLRPVAMAYQHVLPAPLRDGVHNILSNLGEPAVLANDLLQGRLHQARLTTGRLIANTTLGVGGVFDVASKMGAPHHDNGFDITLGRYSVKPGPYLFIPLVGPSSVRGLVGAGVDALFDPLHWVKYPNSNTVSIVRIVVGGVDTRARVDDQLQALMSDATDPYATLRSVYIQNEESQVNAGRPAADQPLPDFGDSTPAPGSPAPVAAPPSVQAPAPAVDPATPPPTPPAPDGSAPVAPAPAAPAPQI